MGAFNKFILTNKGIVFCKVTYHEDIVKLNDMKDTDVIGGGMFDIDTSNKIIVFFGESSKYGTVEYDEMKKAVDESKVFHEYATGEIVNDLTKKYKFIFQDPYLMNRTPLN